MRVLRAMLTLLAACAIAAVGRAAEATAAAAQSYPTRPVRLVVPFAPGGGNDIVARIMAQALSEHFGQQFVVDNRPGAAGNIGVEIVARAQPDGHTILVGNVSTNAINPTGFASVLKFDPVKDLTAVALLASIPNVLVSGIVFPPNTLKELVEYTKARPGQLNYSNPIGAYSHLDMLDFSTRAGMQALNVPSKGAGSSIAAVIAGEIHYSFLNAATITPQVRAGRMKAFVTTARQRLPELPEVPTLAEAGYPNVGSVLWIGFFVPSKTPGAVIDALHAAVVQTTQRPQVRETFARSGVPMTVSASPAEFQGFVRDEIARWARIIKENNVKLE
jgi:tripartite-type tricarboxylate transporter receptor subunit TctC